MTKWRRCVVMEDLDFEIVETTEEVNTQWIATIV